MYKLLLSIVHLGNIPRIQPRSWSLYRVHMGYVRAHSVLYLFIVLYEALIIPGTVKIIRGQSIIKHSTIKVVDASAFSFICPVRHAMWMRAFPKRLMPLDHLCWLESCPAIPCHGYGTADQLGVLTLPGTLLRSALFINFSCYLVVVRSNEWASCSTEFFLFRGVFYGIGLHLVFNTFFLHSFNIHVLSIVIQFGKKFVCCPKVCTAHYCS